MTRSRRVRDRVAERVMDLDSPAHGDERERAVSMESSSFGLAAGICAGLLGAVVAARFGLVLVTVALRVMAILPSFAAVWYAKRRGVDLQELAENAGTRSTMIGVVACGSAMVLALAAMGRTVVTGRPVLPAPSLGLTRGEGFLGGMAQGAVVGGVLGGLAAIAVGVRSYRRANRRRGTGGR